MPSNFKVSSDIDTLLRKQTRQEAADYLGLELPITDWGDITGTLSDQTDLQDALDAKAPILNATFEGTTTIPSADITTADITTADFNAAGVGGELSWNNQEKTLNLATGSGAGVDEVVIQVGQEVVLYAKNKSNADMTNGQVVLISGTAGQEPSIELAQADTVGNARRAIGVITQDIADNASGFVTLIGKVRGLELDENTFSLGEVVYLSSTVAGGITTVKPNIPVEIGHVVDVSSGNNKQGVLEVQLNNESAVYELEQELTTAINLKAPLVDPAFTTTPQGLATINNNSILTEFNVGLDVQGHSDILDGTTASFTEAQATAIIDNYAATPHNTDSVIICNDGDDIQAKYDEAVLLSVTNKASLIVMNGTYGDLTMTDAGVIGLGVDIVGIGNPFINAIEDSTLLIHTSTFKNFTCGSFTIYSNNGTIKNVNAGNVLIQTNFNIVDNINVTNGSFNVNDNLGIIRKVICSSFEVSLSYYGTIEDITCAISFKSDFDGNFGTIKNVNASEIYIENNNGTVDNANATGDFITSNAGVIKNCSAGNKFEFSLNGNNGIIDNCHSNGTDRGFGGYIGSINSGTIKNCTAKGASSFGQQAALGLTENCTGVNQAFIGDTSQVSGDIIEGTYRNCKGGNKSFLGQNTSTIIKECRANYINCTAAVNSFCFVNSVGAETHFSGTAINCTSGSNGFCKAATNGNTKILAGAIIENCTGGANSFAPTISSTNEGTILRCRTATKGVNAFRVTGTGKVRLCLDGDYNEVNLG